MTEFKELMDQINKEGNPKKIWKARREAIRPMVQLKTEEAINEVIKLLREDNNSSVRVRAAIVLGEEKVKTSKDALLEALERDWDSGVRFYSLRSLGLLGLPRQEVLKIMEQAEKSDNRKRVRNLASKIKNEILAN